MTKTNLNSILEKLSKMAMEDGKVTEDEEKFLARIRADIEIFEKSVEEAKIDKKISDDEFHEFVVLRDKILADAMDLSTESEDVNNMVKELYREINDFVIPGMLDEEMIEDE